MHTDPAFVIVPPTGPFVRLVAADHWFGLKAAQGHPISPAARDRLVAMPCHLGVAPAPQPNTHPGTVAALTAELDAAVQHAVPRINAAIARMRAIKQGEVVA